MSIRADGDMTAEDTIEDKGLIGSKQEKPHIRDLKEIYEPLLKIVVAVIDGLEKLDLHIPIYKIARMVTQHKFDGRRHGRLRKYITHYLLETNEYRKEYWTFINLCQRTFDDEMKKDGSYGVTAKQYKSLRTELPDALLRGNDSYWVNSYDMYLPEIRKHSNKTSGEPRSGREMCNAIYSVVKSHIGSIHDRQRKLIVESQEFKESLETVCRDPRKRWREHELEEWSEENYV